MAAVTATTQAIINPSPAKGMLQLCHIAAGIQERGLAWMPLETAIASGSDRTDAKRFGMAHEGVSICSGGKAEKHCYADL